MNLMDSRKAKEMSLSEKYLKLKILFKKTLKEKEKFQFCFD
jgi:hypothetical protein